MISIKKFRTSLPVAMCWSGDIVGFAREEIGTFATVAHWQSVGDTACGDGESPHIDPDKIEIDLILAAPTEGDMKSAVSLCTVDPVEIPLTYKEVLDAQAVLARDIVRHVCCNPKVYDMVVDAILSRFPAARQAPTVEEALVAAYEQCIDDNNTVTEPCDEVAG